MEHGAGQLDGERTGPGFQEKAAARVCNQPTIHPSDALGIGIWAFVVRVDFHTTYGCCCIYPTSLLWNPGSGLVLLTGGVFWFLDPVLFGQPAFSMISLSDLLLRSTWCASLCPPLLEVCTVSSSRFLSWGRKDAEMLHLS